jgi:4-hydroxy-2-oxoheptanedioate aldolase
MVVRLESLTYAERDDDTMQAAITLREKIASGSLITGLLAIDHVWTDLVETSVGTGLDYLIVCLEHGPHSPDLVAEVCATGRRMNFPVLIRPRSNDYATLRHCIDLGACGFLLACVESAKDLDLVRDAIRLPPNGRRRPGGMGNRWVENLTAVEWKAGVEDHFIVLPQIETKVGLKNAKEIAAHEITTALAAGPYDLSAELGVCGQMSAPPLKAALQSLKRTATECGKGMWMIGSNVVELVNDGFTFLCIGEPTWILDAALREKVKQGRAALGQELPTEAAAPQI